MGMIGYLRRLPAAELEALIRGEKNLDDYRGEDAPGGVLLDLDKAWHGISYLLCGHAWEGEGPLFDALMGGTPLNDSDREDVIVRYLSPEQVRDVALALEPIGDEQLSQGFDPDDMNENGVYPAPDWNDAGELDYLLGYYGPMKAHYAQAAAEGEGMLIYVA